MQETSLTISSKNYSSWSMRGWLLCRMAGLAFVEKLMSSDDPSTRAELLLLSPSFLVPCLRHDGATVWDTLAIAEYLAERHAGMWPADPAARAWARSIAAEMHSSFQALRDEMTMCVRGRLDVRPWSAGLANDVARVEEIWAESRRAHGRGGPYLCGALSIADAFYAPVAFRFQTYRVAPGGEAGAYLAALLAHPFMREWERDAVGETIVIEADEPRFVYRDKLAGRG